MKAQIEQLIDLYDFTTGRRLFAMQNTLKEAEARELTELTGHIGRAIEADLELMKLEADWRRQKSGSRSKREASKIDWQIDRTLSAIDTVAEATARAEEPHSDIIDRVAKFRDELLPAGVQEVTSMPHVEELSEVERIIGLLRGSQATMVEELGLERFVTRLEALASTFEQLIKQRSQEVSFDDIRAARTKGQRRLLQTVAIVMGTFLDDTEEHIRARNDLLGPIVDQNEAIAEYLRARRSIPDVDPDTGEPEPEDGESETPTDTTSPPTP